MPRIDALIAPTIGEASRPRQTNRDIRLQAETARTVELDDTSGSAAGPDAVQAAAARLKQVVEITSGNQLGFELDDDSGELVAKITDNSTGHIVRQIPTKEMLDLHRRLDELVGMIINKTA